MSSQREEEWGKERNGVLVGRSRESITVPTLGRRNRQGARENKREGTREREREQEASKRHAREMCVYERDRRREGETHTYTHVGMCCGDINGVPSRPSPSVSVWERRLQTHKALARV